MTNEEVLETLTPLLGMHYFVSIKDYVGDLTGRARILGPGDLATREFDSNRVNIRIDKAGYIAEFTFS